MHSEELRAVYDGSNSTFGLLKAFGWGPLVNLGYISLPQLPAVLVGGLAPFQQRLAHESIALLDPRAGDRVLDACCGRGYTTARIAETGADVLGVDLLEEHVRLARTHHGTGPTQRFGVADVTQLPEKSEGFRLDDGTVDRVLCLEAGFHFGAEGRRDFLAEAARILAPGGRLVLVDFAWSDDDPGSIAELDPDGLVRDMWKFEEFEPFERYRAAAADAGFREAQICDWSEPVMARFQRMALFTGQVGMFPPARKVMSLFRPKLARVEPEAWGKGVEVLRAHARVQTKTRYVAFVLEKR